MLEITRLEAIFEALRPETLHLCRASNFETVLFSLMLVRYSACMHGTYIGLSGE